MATPQIIKESSQELIIADASVYVAKKGKYIDQEVISLTFVNYGKLSFITLPLEVAKKVLPINPGEGKASLSLLLGLKLKVSTVYSTL